MEKTHEKKKKLTVHVYRQYYTAGVWVYLCYKKL